MWLLPVHLCSKTGLDLPQQSLLQWQPHKSTLRNQQFTSWSAYLFCWWIAFGEINGLWFREIITTSSGVFFGSWPWKWQFPLNNWPQDSLAARLLFIQLWQLLLSSSPNRAGSADSERFSTRTYSLLIAKKRSPDACFCTSQPPFD